MFNKLKLFAFLLLILCSSYVKTFSQPDITLTVDPSITNLDIGSIIVSNDLRGAPQIFCVYITPQNPENKVSFECQLYWQAPEGGSMQNVGGFSTEPFAAQRVCNNDIGVGNIRVHDSHVDNSIIDETRRRGKLTGMYEIKVRAFENGIASDWKSEQISFLNQTQTFAIIRPDYQQECDQGNVLAEWNNVPGATYEIKANIRKNYSQSLEEALNTGIPLVNNKNVGSLTSINLRSILERDWSQGDEIVLQVCAIPGSGNKLYSNIVNFRIKSDTPPRNNMFNNSLLQLLQNSGNQILQNLLSGSDLNIGGITLDDGTTMTIEELTLLLNKLTNNPALLLKIEFLPR